MDHLLAPSAVAIAALHGLLLGVKPPRGWPAATGEEWTTGAEAGRTVTVHRPLVVVADYLANFGNAPGWHPEIAESNAYDDAPACVGSRWRTVSAGDGRVTEYRLVRRRPHWITLVGGGRGYVETIEFALTDLDECTEVHAIWRHRSSGVRALTPGRCQEIVARLADEAAAALCAGDVGDVDRQH